MSHAAHALIRLPKLLTHDVRGGGRRRAKLQKAAASPQGEAAAQSRFSAACWP